MDRKRLWAVVFLICSFSAFSLPRICFGAFLNEDFADTLSVKLAENGVETMTVAKERYSGSVYLYVVSDEYPTTRAAAAALNEFKQSGLLSRLGAADAYVAELEPFTIRKKASVAEAPKSQSQPKPVTQQQKPKPKRKSTAAEKPAQSVKTTADEETLPLNETVPYSVFLERYKEEAAAERAKIQLQENDIDAYIVHQFDDEALISFDLHSGAFKNEADAETYRARLEKQGISTQAICHLDDLKKSIEKFDNLKEKKAFVHFEENYETPPMLSTEVIEQLGFFPIHPDFSLKTLLLADVQNLRRSKTSDAIAALDHLQELSDGGPSLFTEVDQFDAFSYAVYENSLFGKSVTVLIFSVNEATDQLMELTARTDLIRFQGNGVPLSFFQLDNDAFLGISDNCRHVCFLASSSFEKNEWEDYIKRAWQDEDRFIYPEVRKTLFILPKTEDEKRLFLTFELTQVEEEYAEQKHNAKWAKMIVGHWNAACEFDIDGTSASISFFNLDYDLNAAQTHAIFMETHRDTSGHSDWNVSEEQAVNGKEGWFLEMEENKNELSFSFKPYIIAVGSRFEEKMLSRKEILQLAHDLQIWEN